MNDCPVEFAYFFPENSNDNHHWIFALIRNQKELMINLHSHAIHGPTNIENVDHFPLIVLMFCNYLYDKHAEAGQFYTTRILIFTFICQRFPIFFLTHHLPSYH